MNTFDISSKNILSSALISRLVPCMEEYEAIKNKTSKNFRFVKDLCKYYKISHQNLMRLYSRYKKNKDPQSLLPRKRGPKFNTRRTDINVEERVVELRKQSYNRYEIVGKIQSEMSVSISLTTAYNIFCRNNLNNLSKLEAPIKQEKPKIIMERVGELCNCDCYQLPRGITIANSNKIYYLLGFIDAYSRIAWVEVLDSKKSLDVMFATLKSLNILNLQYGIRFDSIMTDNGAEFGSGRVANNKDSHPFERLLLEMGIKHRYTRPYRPQTNGKIERFWKTLYEDFLDGSLYEDIEDLKDELLGFLVYYNEHRLHSAIGHKTPLAMLRSSDNLSVAAGEQPDKKHIKCEEDT